MTAGLLMVGALFTTANAQTNKAPEGTKFDGTQFFYLKDASDNIVSAGELAEVAGPPKFSKLTILNTAVSDQNDNSLWKITAIERNGGWDFVLTNKGTGGVLTFTNAGEIPSVNDANNTITKLTWLTTTEYTKDGGLQAAGLSGKPVVAFTDKEIKLNATWEMGTGGTALIAYTVDDADMPIADLNSKMGNGFILNAKDGSTVITSAENGLFNKKLTAITLTESSSSNEEAKAIVGGVGASKTFFFTQSAATTALLQAATAGVLTINSTNAEDVVKNFKAATVVAVDKVKSVSAASSVAGYGYAFSNFTGAALLGANDTNKDVPVNNAWMTVKYNLNDGAAATNDNMIITVAAKFPDSDGKMTVDATVRPQISTTGDVNTLMAIPEGTDVEKWAQIGFGASSAVTIDAFKGKAFSVTVVDKKDANKNITGYTIHPEGSSWEKSSEFLANRPEGQWVVTYDKDNKKFALNNRETGDAVDLGAIVIYQVENTTDQFALSTGLTIGALTVDTLKLTEQSLTPARLGGYANGGKFDKVALLSTAYKLGIRNNPSDEPVFIQNSGVHNNTLSINVKTDEGLSFYLIPSIDTLAYGINQETTKYYEAIVNKNDSLRRIPYALQERVTKRFVTLDADGKYILNPTITNAEEAAQFFLKEKEDGQYVMVTKTDDKKVYVNVGTGYLHNEDDLYKKDIADEFGLYESTSPKYADILKDLKAESDTTLANINLYSVQNLVGNSAYMLASGENDFLVEGVPSTALKSMGGLAYDSVAFSIAVDTAYVNRAGNTMPLYYLAQKGAKRGEKVGPLHSGEKDQYGHPVECTHYAMNDTVVGKYLFAMYDSIVYAKDKDIKKEDYCYHYTNTEHFARLRFVDAKHIADTMIVASVKPSAKDTLKAGAVSTDIIASRQAEWLKGFEVSEEFGKAVKEHLDVTPTDDNFGLFAFEINPENEKEYAIYNPATGYYVAYLNGNVVLARQASYYTMVNGATEGMDVVANEDLNASAISVIAGNGDVTIKGAEGKKVVITNVLGQTVANTVLSSDNATIAAPQGVVVVAVEGEAAVKAIVK